MHYGAEIDDDPSSPTPNQARNTAPTPPASTVKADTAKLATLQDLNHRIQEREAVLADLESRIIETREINLLQDLGIYDFSHPLEDAVQYKNRLTQLRTSIKVLVKERAVTGATNWAVNGNLAKGAQMVREQCKVTGQVS